MILQELMDLLKVTEDKELIYMRQQSLLKQNEIKQQTKQLTRELQELEIESDKNKEKVRCSLMGRRVKLSHPNKCERCDKIESNIKSISIISKENGGEDSPENKIKLCKKCFPIVNTYVDDLWDLYHDAKMVKKYVIADDHPLDKRLRVKKYEIYKRTN